MFHVSCCGFCWTIVPRIYYRKSKWLSLQIWQSSLHSFLSTSSVLELNTRYSLHHPVLQDTQSLFFSLLWPIKSHLPGWNNSSVDTLSRNNRPVLYIRRVELLICIPQESLGSNTSSKTECCERSYLGFMSVLAENCAVSRYLTPRPLPSTPWLFQMACSVINLSSRVIKNFALLQ